MIKKSSVKAGAYFSHSECFGHTSRVIAISQIFKKRFPDGDFFFIQAGVEQPKVNFDQNGQVYSLPHPFMNRSNFRSPLLHPETHVGIRAQACVDIIVRERPNLFLTEFFPLGREECRHELIPALAKGFAEGVELWGVAGYPLLIGTGDGWREKILKLYQKIVIFAPLIEKDMIAASILEPQERERYHDFFKRHEQKIKFAGYLLPEGGIINYKEDANSSKPPIPRGACRVAVVRGGGAYYPKIIAEAIRASDLLGEEYYLTVVAGPSTTLEEWYFFSTLMTKKEIKNVALLKSIVDYEGLIKDSDICVATASYHTSVMLLKHQKKAVIIPFEGYTKEMSFAEQPARAEMLRKIIDATVIPIQKLKAVTLASSIKAAAHRTLPTMNIPKDWFNGGETLGAALTELFPR
jgi:predicted glycosyltransferase